MTPAFTYDKAKRQETILDARGNVTTNTYYDDSQLHLVEYADGGIASYTYDAAKRKRTSTNPENETTTYSYFPDSQLQAEMDPVGCLTTYAYDLANRQTEVLDGEGNVTTTVYDRAGRTIATVDGEGDRTSFTYDKANRRTRLTDARNQVTTFEYDDAGRMVKQTDALGRVCTYQYDGVDNVTLKWDARNTRCTMTYDAANRLTKEDFSNADQAGVAAMNYANTFVYDDSNNQTELSDPTGTITRSFSGRNNRLWESNRDNKRVTYTYDCVENRDTMRDADSGRFTYTFDEKNRLRTTTNPKNEVTTCSYDLADRETQRDLANGTFMVRDYDLDGRIEVLTNEKVAGGLISKFTYTYDCADNRENVQELDGTLVTWTYDQKYQLLSEHRDDTSPSSSYRNTYTYDPTGNRLTKVATETSTTYVYDDCNELTSETTWQLSDPPNTRVNVLYTYDKNGSRTERDPDDAGATTFYDYDAQNRVIVVDSGTAVTFDYNAADQRVEKTYQADTTKYIFDYKKLLQETDGADATTALYTSTLRDEYGDLVSQFDNTNSGFFQYDALGSTNELTDSAAVVKNQYKYDGWGAVVYESEDVNYPTPYTWIGMQGYYKDPELAEEFPGKGVYDPATGQTIKPDPIGLKGGDANLYRWVHNNPINKTDPSGLEEPASRPGDLLRKFEAEQALMATTRGLQQRLLRQQQNIGRLTDDAKEVLGQLNQFKTEATKEQKWMEGAQQELNRLGRAAQSEQETIQQNRKRSRENSEARQRLFDKQQKNLYRMMSNNRDALESLRRSQVVLDEIGREFKRIGIELDRNAESLAKLQQDFDGFMEEVDDFIAWEGQYIEWMAEGQRWTPFHGDAIDAMEAISGETITGKQLSKTEQGVTVVAFLVPIIPGSLFRGVWRRIVRFFRGSAGEVAEEVIEEAAGKLAKEGADVAEEVVEETAGKLAKGKADEAVAAAEESVEAAHKATRVLPASTAESVSDKLRRYLLDPNHPVGGDKATWFRKALGFTQDNLDDLARQIKFDPAKAVATELTQHGQKFEQVITIVGANGKRIDTLFVWIRNNDGVVRLVTSTLGVK